VNIECSKHVLANGLQVLVHEDRDLPIVAVNIWYHVGSKNERPGRTGFAHLFEHLMFEGSQHHDRGYFQPLQEAGGTLNGSTNADRTNYWEVVPTGALERALWMESDRMGYLLPALTQEKLDNQRDVVLNERRQNYENRPYGLAVMAILSGLYPPDHSYSWPTIGSAEDLRAASMADVQEFFRTYYHAGNASLALAGDIDPDRALDLVLRYFGDLEPGPARPPVHPPDVAPPSAGARLVLEDRVELPRLYLTWPSPALFGAGDAEMDLLADMLGNGKTSRLYRTLIYERRMATELGAAQHSRELSGFLQIVATAAPGHRLDEIERVVTEALAAIAASGPSDDELERARAQAEANFIYRLQTVGGFGGKSDQLNAYNVFVNDPAYFDRDLQRYRQVTRESIVRTASALLRPELRVALSVVPHGRAADALAGSSPVTAS
jgi:zinc protease